MATREIRTFQETLACDVCGRTLLRGERTETWLAGGSRREVCELCTARARHEGWVREGARLDMPSGRAAGGDRRRSLLGRLREVGERVGDRRREDGEEPAEEELEGGAPADLIPEVPVAPARAAAPPPLPSPGDPYGFPRERRNIHAVPTDPGHRVASAVQVFNASEFPRTVAGVARSLGVPAVAVRPSAGTSRVAIVVSWELSWYRYEVDLSDPQSRIQRVAQGYELSELPEEDKVPNASADEYGRLHLAAA